MNRALGFAKNERLIKQTDNEPEKARPGFKQTVRAAWSEKQYRRPRRDIRHT